MFERFRMDESGMTMGLVVIMIVLIGVMGAGLLTFVSTDLNTVVEVNQGQKAFEMADAGVAAAKKQLTSNPTSNNYDSVATSNVQWGLTPPVGATQTGVIMSDLDGDGNGAGGTGDSVTVTIESLGASSFRVISTGRYGDARRRIEAVLRKSNAAGRGLPAYYTPGNIQIKDGTSVQSVSMFAGGNIILDPISGGAAGFRADYENNSGVLKIDPGADDLGNWNTTTQTPPVFWNTVGRRGYPAPGGSTFTGVGFAAEGRICGTSSCNNDSESIADGVYGYDSTTGTKGNGLKFAVKRNCSTGAEERNRNPNGTDCGTPARNLITYPFPKPTVDADYLLGIARSQLRSGAGSAESRDNYVDLRSPPLGAGDSLNLDELYPNPDVDRVVFIDANGTDIAFTTSNAARNKGILVVRCAGKISFTQKFEGVIIALAGEDGVHGSDCGADDKGRVEIDKVNAGIFGYVLSEYNPGSPNDPSISIIGGSGSDATKIDDLPEGTAYDNLLARYGVSLGNGFTNLSVSSWRERYE